MRIAFVIPWYGRDIPGGAESECRNTALKLRAASFDVEILTTCVRDFYSDWNTNFHKPGSSHEEGIPTHRFPIRKRDAQAFDEINNKLMYSPLTTRDHESGPRRSPITLEEEEIYLRETINSPGLYRYLEMEGKKYDFLLFIPYMFGTTYFGSQILPDRSLLIPCLHNEGYAYMQAFTRMFRSVRASLCHMQAEERLIHSLYGKDAPTFVVGEGVDTTLTADPSRFLDKYRLQDPFFLYVGKKDPGKNVHLLLDYYTRYLQRNNKPPILRLVLIGKGRIPIPKGAEAFTIDLGYIPNQDKYDAMAAAEFLCVPSTKESFSLVMMESLLAGRPALGHEESDVAVEHCQKGQCGLYFSNVLEFCECVEFLTANSGLAAKMGQNGRRYVLENYSWENVIARYRAIFAKLHT